MEDEEFLPRTPIDRRTPITEAFIVLCELARIHEMWGYGDFEKFAESFFKPMWDDENTSGEYQIDQIKVAEEMTEWEGEPLLPRFKEGCIAIATLMTSCAFAVQAMKAEKNSNAAWSYTCEAHHWLGILQGVISGLSMEGGTSTLAKLGAAARHAENRKMKSEVFAWCDANMASYKSMDSAAEAVAGKEVPVTFRTARSWISEWKKLRSTGTP